MNTGSPNPNWQCLFLVDGNETRGTTTVAVRCGAMRCGENNNQAAEKDGEFDSETLP
jgi:hypothetical protein